MWNFFTRLTEAITSVMVFVEQLVLSPVARDAFISLPTEPRAKLMAKHITFSDSLGISNDGM